MLYRTKYMDVVFNYLKNMHNAMFNLIYVYDA